MLIRELFDDPHNMEIDDYKDDKTEKMVTRRFPIPETIKNMMGFLDGSFLWRKHYNSVSSVAVTFAHHLQTSAKFDQVHQYLRMFFCSFVAYRATRCIRCSPRN